MCFGILLWVYGDGGVVFFIGCEVVDVFDGESLCFKVGGDEGVGLLWFEGDVDASCFDHEDGFSLFFKVSGDVGGEDVCLMALGDILIDEVDGGDEGGVSFGVVGVLEDRDDIGSMSGEFEEFVDGKG